MIYIADEPEDAGLDEDFPLGDGTADTDAAVSCPYCGETVVIALDPSSGMRQPSKMSRPQSGFMKSGRGIRHTCIILKFVVYCSNQSRSSSCILYPGAPHVQKSRYRRRGNVRPHDDADVGTVCRVHVYACTRRGMETLRQRHLLVRIPLDRG